MSMKKLLYTIPFICLFLQSCEKNEISPYPELVLQQKSGIPAGGRSTAVSFTIHDTAYVALGRGKFSWQAKNDCWAYYPETDSWVRKADFPSLARVNAVAEVVDNKAYVGLGYQTLSDVYNNESYLRDWWMYDAENNQWTQKADYPGEPNAAPYTSGNVSFVVGDYIFIGAGFNSYSFSNNFWKYNTKTDTWTQVKDFIATSRAIATAVNANGRIFFGTGYHTYNLNDWWEYIAETDKWLKRKNMPDNGRVNALSFSVNGRVFVATGRHFGGTETTGRFFSDILEYDIEKDCWYHRANLLQGRENAISFVLQGRAYIGMGENDQEVFNDLYSFEP